MTGTRAMPLLQRLQKNAHLPERLDCRDAYEALQWACVLLRAFQRKSSDAVLCWETDKLLAAVEASMTTDPLCRDRVME